MQQNTCGNEHIGLFNKLSHLRSACWSILTVSLCGAFNFSNNNHRHQGTRYLSGHAALSSDTIYHSDLGGYFLVRHWL